MSGVGQVNMNGHDNKLQIKNVAYNDSGSYVCVATSILGKAQKTVKLTVEGDADNGNTWCRASSIGKQSYTPLVTADSPSFLPENRELPLKIFQPSPPPSSLPGDKQTPVISSLQSVYIINL